MDPNLFKRNELLAQKVIKGLQSRNMSAEYARSREEALRKALEQIPEGSTIAMGGAMSAHEIGLVDELRNGPYHFIDRDAMADKRAAMLAAYDADVFEFQPGFRHCPGPPESPFHHWHEQGL